MRRKGTQQPTYLSSLISYHHSSHLLRSTGQSLLNVHRMKTEFIWNNITLGRQTWLSRMTWY